MASRQRSRETVRSTFVRFEDSRLSGMTLGERVDWRREDNLPAVYLLVRVTVQADTTDVATQDQCADIGRYSFGCASESSKLHAPNSR
ncbi:DUF2471 family protein [Paraburkholderia sediminicola]